MRTSPMSLKEVVSIQRNGKTIRSAPAINTTYVTRSNARRRPTMLAVPDDELRIVDPPRLQSDLDDRDGEQNGEEHKRQGRGIAHAEVGESVEEDLVDERQRRIAGSTLGHDVGLLEDLKAGDQSHDRCEENRRCEQGNRDVAKLVPSLSAIEFRRFVEVPGNALQPCKEDDDVEPETTPDAHDDHARHRHRRID